MQSSVPKTRRSTNTTHYASKLVLLAFNLNAVIFGAATNAVASTNIIAQLKKDDKSLSQGALIYRRENINRYFKVSFTYDKSLRFISQQQAFSNINLMGRQTQQPVTQVFDGRDTFLVVKSNNPKQRSFIEIKTEKPEDAAASYRFSGGLYPGPGLVQGRGLSFLTKVSLKYYKNDITFRGEIAGGKTVEAILDRQHGFVAKKINLLHQGRPFARIFLSRPILSKQGVWIASCAGYEFLQKGKFVQNDKYTLLQANFVAPSPQTFDVMLPKDFMVIDGRLGDPINWNMTSIKSPASLLVNTQIKVNERLAERRKQAKIQQLRGYMNMLLLMLPILLFGAVYQWRQNRKMHSKDAQDESTPI